MVVNYPASCLSTQTRSPLQSSSLLQFPWHSVRISKGLLLTFQNEFGVFESIKFRPTRRQEEGASFFVTMYVYTNIILCSLNQDAAQWPSSDFYDYRIRTTSIILLNNSSTVSCDVVLLEHSSLVV